MRDHTSFRWHADLKTHSHRNPGKLELSSKLRTLSRFDSAKAATYPCNTLPCLHR